MYRFTLFLVLLTMLASARVLCADDWPGWRGPGNRGISAETDLPLTWSATQNVRWKAAVPGAGVSSPVVWGKHVFLTASDGRRNDRLHVLCFHADDGKFLWPGFGENSRVLKWIFDRSAHPDASQVTKTAIGHIPSKSAFDTKGLGISDELFEGANRN